MTYYVLGSINNKFVEQIITAKSPQSAIDVYLLSHKNVYAIGVYPNKKCYDNGNEPLEKWMSEKCASLMAVLAAKYGDL